MTVSRRDPARSRNEQLVERWRGQQAALEQKLADGEFFSKHLEGNPAFERLCKMAEDRREEFLKSIWSIPKDKFEERRAQLSGELWFRRYVLGCMQNRDTTKSEIERLSAKIEAAEKALHQE